MQQLKSVMEVSAARTDAPVGILTSENRDTWAKAYNILSKGK